MKRDKVVALPFLRPLRRLPSAGTCAFCRAIASRRAVTSCASCASSPAGCLVTYLRAAASHPPVSLPLVTPLPLVLPLLGLTQAGCHLASPHAAASHLSVPPPLIATLPLVPLVWLVIVSSILTPPPPPIYWRIHLSSRHCLSSHSIQASCLLAGCHISPTPHVNTSHSHLSAPLPIILQFAEPLITPLSVLSSGWLSHRLFLHSRLEPTKERQEEECTVCWVF